MANRIIRTFTASVEIDAASADNSPGEFGPDELYQHLNGLLEYSPGIRVSRVDEVGASDLPDGGRDRAPAVAVGQFVRVKNRPSLGAIVVGAYPLADKLRVKFGHLPALISIALSECSWDSSRDCWLYNDGTPAPSVEPKLDPNTAISKER